MEKANLNSLKAIRIVKNISTLEFAKYFEISKSHIYALESGERNLKFKTLKNGLDNLNISLEDYYELEEYSLLLSNSNFSEKKKYALFLIKAIGVTKKEMKEETEKTLSKYKIKYDEGIDKKALRLQKLKKQINILNNTKKV